MRRLEGTKFPTTDLEDLIYLFRKSGRNGGEIPFYNKI